MDSVNIHYRTFQNESQRQDGFRKFGERQIGEHGNLQKRKKSQERNIILLTELNCGTTKKLPIWN